MSVTERLVELSWKRYGSDKINFEHNSQNSPNDARGEDFSDVRMKGYTFTEPFQIKTSNNGKTIGIVLPFSRRQNGKCVSLEMEKEIKKHERKHSHVKCLLFVAKPHRNLRKIAILRRIWKETIYIFQELKRQKHKKHGNIRPLAFTKGLCYNVRG